jgi:hypothetical protein
METNKLQRYLAWASQFGFGMGGSFWTADGLVGTVRSFGTGDFLGGSLQLGRTALDGTFTWGAWRATKQRWAMARAKAMPKALKQATPSLQQNVPLAIDESTQLGEQAAPWFARVFSWFARLIP